MKLIDYQNSRPIYEQIVENFKLQMYKGILQADEQMPSVRSLAMELSTNLCRKRIQNLKGRGSYIPLRARATLSKGMLP